MVARVGGEPVPNGGPSLGVDQRRMLSGVELALVCNLTDVNRVRQQFVDVPAREGSAAALGPAGRRAALGPEAEAVGLLLDPAYAAELTIKGEDAAHRFGFGGVDDERAFARVVAERHDTAHPHALLLRGSDPVTDPFAGDLPLKLGKRQQHIEGQPIHRARGIELLGYRHERHALCVEDLDQPGKIGERARQPVDLVDDDDVDPASLDVGKQLLQCRPLHVATREPAVVVAGSGQYPALVTLAADIGLASFALRLERVELLFEPFLGGFAGVDRAALPARVTPRHRSPPSSRGSEAALARAGGLPIGFVSARRTADPTTPCR